MKFWLQLCLLWTIFVLSIGLLTSYGEKMTELKVKEITFFRGDSEFSFENIIDYNISAEFAYIHTGNIKHYIKNWDEVAVEYEKED